MSALRTQLTRQLERKVEARGLVLWADEAGEYRDVAAGLAPAGVRFEALAGSTYELRQRVENALASIQRPRMVVYVDRAPPRDNDPLAELRAASSEFKVRLATLVRQAMAGQLTEARVAEIGHQAVTFAEAEAALVAAGHHSVRVVSLLGETEATRLVLAVFKGDRDEPIGSAGAWPEVATTMREVLGGRIEGEADLLQDSIFRHLVLTALSQAAGALPERLAPAWEAPSAEQRGHVAEVLRQLQLDPSLATVFLAQARRADEELDLAHELSWNPGLEDLVATEALEELVFAEVLRRLELGDAEGAAALARTRRQRSIWALRPEAGAATWGPRWRAAEAAGAFFAALSAAPPPVSGTAGQLLDWYRASGVEVDRAQRRLELARTGLARFGELEATFAKARGAYHRWLDRFTQGFSAALETGPIEVGGDLVRQGEIHDRYVSAASGSVAYVWVDALRYEMGVDLAAALAAGGAQVEVHGAVAAAPTVTQVGMANLLPGAAAGLRIGIAGDELVVSIGGTVLGRVSDRVELLRARHGRVVDMTLDDAAQLGDTALGHKIAGAALVLVRSTEVDSAGEAGMLSVGWSSFEATTSLLSGVVARLLHAGMARVVITADHGFIALGEALGPSWVVDPPGGVGVLKRRVFLGRGGTTTDATLRVPLSATGVPGDLDLIVPRGLGVFRAGGARQFFHGGLSPQELLVPVLVIDANEAPESANTSITITTGARITTGAFSAMVELAGNLLTTTTLVRVSAVGPDARQVARVVAGDGFDSATDAVTLTSTRRSVLTFQVTANLAVGSQVELRVSEARTGRVVAKAAARVASPVVVEDDLG